MRMITGKTGTKHVRAKDDARIIRLLLGNGDFVLPDGNQLSATLDQSLGKVTISNGYLVMQGRQAGIDPSDSSEVITLEPGVANVNRIDLIYAEYNIYQNGIETVTLNGVVGTPSASVPFEPVLPYEGGDIDNRQTRQVKLYRVNWTGTTGVLERALEPIDTVPLNSLLATVAEYEADITAEINATKTYVDTVVSEMSSMVQGHWLITGSILNVIDGSYKYGYSYLSLPAGINRQNSDIITGYVNGLKVPVSVGTFTSGTTSTNYYRNNLASSWTRTNNGKIHFAFGPAATSPSQQTVMCFIDATEIGAFSDDKDELYLEIWR